MNQTGAYRHWVLCGAFAGSALLACAGEADSQSTFAEQGQAIVRGEETDRFDQVVMLHVQGQAGTSRCTGSYISPRLVLTAAHCIGAGAIPQLSYVYFGDDEAPASDATPEIPAPGTPSDFALIESFRVHPEYDPSVNHPDLAVVYLDRELPFAPLPLMTERIGRRSVGERATIVGWGGSRALVPDISEVEGAGVKRKGQVRLLGSPTAADFRPEDPNPGMLDAEVRAQSLKVDGRAPRANTCAGDSGGPLLIQKHGRSYVAGVAYWTGLSCEDYSMYVRLDPFVDFIRDAQRAVGRAPILPRLECVDRAEDGTYTAFFGYDNQNGISIELPHSRRNALAQDSAGARPELFAPGDHPFVFSVDFEKRERLSYLLAPPHAPARVAFADKRSPRCECAAACDAQLAAECSSGTFSRSQCVAECAPFAQLFPGCQQELNAYFHCVAELPPAAENWICDPSFIPQPVLCQEEFVTALACGGYL